MASVHEVSVLIRESHLDTFGHVNNATYLQLYEEARWDLITANGFGMDTIQRTRTGPVIMEAHVKFQRELRNRERVRIRTELIGYRGKVGELKQTVVKEDGSVASEAVFVFGLLDLDERRLIEPTPAWRAAVGVEEDAPEG
ncbi:MAG: thioesterase [Myxococcales bacterium]|jgi:YbgC/YbaW family acyl-CoA thioester hydrolase|nr:thioesterase [Myxococcales bacterium]